MHKPKPLLFARSFTFQSLQETWNPRSSEDSLPTRHRHIDESQTPASSHPRPLCLITTGKAALVIMPTASPAPSKKNRCIEKNLASVSSPSGSPFPDSPSIQLRTQAIQDVPSWLSVHELHFIAAIASFPLPNHIAFRGIHSYDWNSWGLALLEPNLWRKRGPWQRLIASCTAVKPPNVHGKHVPSIKAALVRIVIAKVVSMLYSRKNHSPTSDDRNRITAIERRQLRRFSRHPTLSLLFDLAFVVFDLANFCAHTSMLENVNEEPARVVEILNGEVLGNGHGGPELPIEIAVERIVDDALRSEFHNETASPLSTEQPENFASSTTPASSSKAAKHPSRAMSAEGIILCVLEIVHERHEGASETWRIDNVKQVIKVTKKLLAKFNAPRWHRRYVTQANAAEEGILLATNIFTRRLPLRNAKVTLEESDPLKAWLRESLEICNWSVWADLANDCNYLMIAGGLPEARVQELVCRHIATNLLGNPELEHGKRPSLRILLDVALALEKFYLFFLETHGIDNVPAARIRWGRMCFERVVQQLSKLWDSLINITNRAEAMIDWCARSLDISNYYRKALQVNQHTGPQRGEDIERAIQSGFSEASWSSWKRFDRFKNRTSSRDDASGSKHGSPDVSQVWLVSLNLNDPVYLACAIVPWDPYRALQLLDQAIGLTAFQMCCVLDGRESLPLWDYRRISLCRILLLRNNYSETKLVMERLQALFDRTNLHVGGNFSCKSITVLEKEVENGNFCAQTTLAMLYAGQGEYWDVARSWAQCEKNIKYGIEKLYLSVLVKDPEAGTAFSYIFTECGADYRREADIESGQVYTLMEKTLTTNNAKALMNVGVIFRYGIPGIERNDAIAIECLLVAIQGGLSVENRAYAAHHLSRAVGEDQVVILEALSQLISPVRPCTSLASRPNSLHGQQAQQNVQAPPQ